MTNIHLHASTQTQPTGYVATRLIMFIESGGVVVEVGHRDFKSLNSMQKERLKFERLSQVKLMDMLITTLKLIETEMASLTSRRLAITRILGAAS